MDILGQMRGVFSARFLLVAWLPVVGMALFVLVLVWSGLPGGEPHFGEAWDTAADLGGAEWLLIGVATTVLALLMYPLHNAIVRLLEGYWPGWLGGLARGGVARQRRRRRVLEAQIDRADTLTTIASAVEELLDDQRPLWALHAADQRLAPVLPGLASLADALEASLDRRRLPEAVDACRPLAMGLFITAAQLGGTSPPPNAAAELAATIGAITTTLRGGTPATAASATAPPMPTSPPVPSTAPSASATLAASASSTGAAATSGSAASTPSSAVSGPAASSATGPAQAPFDRAATRGRFRELAETATARSGAAGTAWRTGYSTSRTLPTRLGNILAAAEQRAGTHYGWDAVSAWPRLYAALNERTRLMVDDQRNVLDSAARMAVTSALAVPPTIWLLADGGWWLLLVLVPLLVCVFAYIGAVNAAASFGEAIVVAFETSRFDLITSLRLPLPADLAAERALAESLCALWRDGRDVPMTYEHP